MPCPICLTTSIINALGLTSAVVGIKKLKDHKKPKEKKSKSQIRDLKK